MPKGVWMKAEKLRNLLNDLQNGDNSIYKSLEEFLDDEIGDYVDCSN